MNKKTILSLVTLLLVVFALLAYKFIADRNKAELDTRWAASVETNQQVLDHSLWQAILDDYLVSDTDTGVNLFDYAGLIDDGRETLNEYLDALSSTNPLLLNRAEQKSYWINLYNAATVALIVDNYPLASITDIAGPVGSFGPWDNDAVVVNSIALSLNDIEHRIIRPIYNDYRIHFAVNCASIGCPNLSAEAFSSSNAEQLLDSAANEFVTHPRGLRLDGNQLQLSSLFDWYAEDFGSNQSQLLETLGAHASPETESALAQFEGQAEFAYDWSLNGYCSIDNECGE